jgi:type II secretory pathway pseudopilin PulG
LELLVVIGIISILLVAVIPAVTSLSKSSGRKGAISNLLGAIEQGRAQAIKDGRATYIVFPAQPIGGSSGITDKTLLDRYFYHSFAVFEDDADTTKPKIQLTPWKTLPTGISIRSDISQAPWTATAFSFTPEGSAKTENFPYIMFNANGEVESPIPTTGPIQLNIFEGYVDGTTETPTSKPIVTETITISHLTGRAERS